MSIPAGSESPSTEATSPRTNPAAPNSVSYTTCFFGSMSFAQTHSHPGSNPSRTRPAPAKKSTKDNCPGSGNPLPCHATALGSADWTWAPLVRGLRELSTVAASNPKDDLYVATFKPPPRTLPDRSRGGVRVQRGTSLHPYLCSILILSNLYVCCFFHSSCGHWKADSFRKRQ